jgi:hypothetical protein
MTRTRLGYGNAEGLSRKNKQAKIVILSVQMNVGGAELSMGWQIGAAERTSHIEFVAKMPIPNHTFDFRQQAWPGRRGCGCRCSHLPFVALAK